MNVNVSKENKTTLIEVSGRIDSTNANQLGEVGRAKSIKVNTRSL